MYFTYSFTRCHKIYDLFCKSAQNARFLIAVFLLQFYFIFLSKDDFDFRNLLTLCCNCNLMSRLLVSDSKLSVVTIQICVINLQIFHQIPLPYFLWRMGGYDFTIVDFFVKSCHALVLLDINEYNL